MKFRLTTAVTALLAAFGLVAEGAVNLSATGSTACADPAADIEVALVSRTGPTTGRVRITGIVKNVGAAAWTARTSSQRLQMVLTQKNSEARPQGDAVQPAIGIAQLAPGQQYRIDYQMNWDANTDAAYPKFIVRVSDSGRLDCRSDNNRKEISAAEINKLFVAPSLPTTTQPLKVQSYRLLGGVGINTVEATLAYRKTSAAAGKLTASVAAPYNGISDEIPITGNNGTVKIRINIPCEPQGASNLAPHPVTITYRLWGSYKLSGASSWVAGVSTQQAIAYSELCAARAPKPL